MPDAREVSFEEVRRYRALLWGPLSEEAVSDIK